MQFLQVQYFYNYMNAVAGLFIGSFHDCPTIAVTLKTLHKSECIGGMESEMNKIIEDPNVQKSYQLNSLKIMKSIFDKINMIRLRIILWTKISMVSGLLTILFSLLVLTTVPYVSNYVPVVFYSLGFFGLIFSISTMTWVIFVCLKEKNYLTNDKSSSQ